MPLVSVIMASFNKAGFIEETINSVLSQTFQDWEFIVVDDASTDETGNILRKFAEKERRIRLFVNDTNKGANACRNYGLQQAKGERVIFLDADDILAPFCIEQRMNFNRANPSLDFSVHVLMAFINTPGDSSTTWRPKSKTPLKDFLYHNIPWQTMQPFWRIDFLKKLNGFDEEFSRMQDVELHTRVLLSKDVSYMFAKGPPDCFYRIDENRKNYNNYEFLSKWISSAIKYCNKFYNLVPIDYRNLLKGTLFQVYFQLLFHYRKGEIKQHEFYELERRILDHNLIIELQWLPRVALKISRFYNLNLPRIPGFNRFLKHAVIYY